MTADLDTALRDMLRRRAADVTVVPERITSTVERLDGLPDSAGDLELLDIGAGRRGPRWVPLAAAAAVAALIAGVVAALIVPSGDVPVTHHRPGPPISRTTCTGVLSPAWRDAVAAGTKPVGAPLAATPAAVTPQGGVVYLTLAQQAARLGYVAPGSDRYAPLAAISLPLSLAAEHRDVNADVDADAAHAVVTISEGRTHAPVRTITLVDLATGQRTPLAHRTIARQLSSDGYLHNGAVYWGVVRARSLWHVMSYDIASGRTTSVADQAVYDLQASAAGLTWNVDGHGVDRPDPTPTAVASYVTSSTAPHMVSDGTAWAWTTPGGAVYYWSPRVDRIVRFPGLLSARNAHRPAGSTTAVAGPFVAYSAPGGAGGDRVLDIRTGATAPLVGGFYGVDGTLIQQALGRVGGSGLSRVAATDLPQIRCG